MKPTFIALLALCLCVPFGCGKKSTTKRQERLLWEYLVQDASFRESPAIGSDGTIYIGPVNTKVYALDGKTGARKWAFEMGIGGEKGRPLGGLAIGSDGTVYVPTLYGMVYALDGETGLRRWETQTTTNSPGFQKVPNDPETYFRFLAGEYSVNGFDADSLLNFPKVSCPAVGPDGTVYVGRSPNGMLYALDGKTGAKKWEFGPGGGILNQSPAIGSDGTVYFASGKVYALDGKTGAKKWEFEKETSISSVTVLGSDGTVYIEAAGGIYALDGKSGAKKWEFDVSGDSLVIGSDGTVYVTSTFYSDPQNSNIRRSSVIALDGNKLLTHYENGKKILSSTKLWESETVGVIDESPAIGSDGTIYVGVRGNLDNKRGEIFTSRICALDGKSGAKKWEFLLKGADSVSSLSIGTNGTLYFGHSSKIYAIKTDSKGLAKSPWPMFGQNPQHTGRAMKK